eukprot:jgi/Tetstr1/437027/TSEL_025787.t1
MTAAGVEMYHHHTELTLLAWETNNLCAISLGQEDDEFADTMRLAVALTSHVALLLWAIRLRTIVIYLTESKFDPSELLIHPFSQTIREAGELGGNTGHNQIRLAAIGLRKKARKTTPASLALRATGCPIYTLTLPDPTDTSNDPNSPDRTLAHADDEEKLELNYEENDNAMEVDTTHASPPQQGTKGKAATTAKFKKKQAMGRSRSDGATRNPQQEQATHVWHPRSDSEWETDDDDSPPV